MANARTVQLLPRINVGPITNQEAPSIALAQGEREWNARLDPAQDYPTVVWTIILEYSLDNQATWKPWRGSTQTGIILNEKGNYPGIGGTFPPGLFPDTPPTHLRGIISLSERINCGLKATSV